MCDACSRRLMPDIFRLKALDYQVDKAEANGNIMLYNLLTETLMTELMTANLKLAACKRCEHLVDPNVFS